MQQVARAGRYNDRLATFSDVQTYVRLCTDQPRRRVYDDYERHALMRYAHSFLKHSEVARGEKGLSHLKLLVPEANPRLRA